MTAIEDRLQELRYTVGVPSLPDVDELGARATRRRRRRRRHRLVAAGTVAVALLVPAVLVARQGDDPDTRVGTESPGQPSPAATTPLPASGIPIVLFGTNPWDGSVFVSDLGAGVRATYADGEHSVDFKSPEHFESDARTGDGSTSSGIVSASLTADGELIAGVMPGPLVVFAPGQSLSEPGRQLPGTADWRAFRPTGSGDGLWIATGAGDLVLVDLATGEVRQSVDGAAVGPLVGVTGDNALLYDGNNNHGRVRMVSPSGDTTLLEPPPGTVEAPSEASFVSADTTRSVWLVDNRDWPPGISSQGLGQTVLIVGPGGDTTEIPVLADDGSIWTWEGSQTGFESMRTLSADGTRLLLNIAPPGTTVPNRLVVVDLVAGTARVVFEGGGVEGFWAADDRTAIVLLSGGAVVAVDTVTGTATTIDHLPEHFRVVAAA
jgi:hypothetical protein